MKRLMWFCSVLVLVLFTMLQADDSSELLTLVDTGYYDLVDAYCSVGYDSTNKNQPIGTRCLDGVDRDGNTAIAIAAMRRNFHIVARLIAAGARLNLVNHKRETPLMQAAKNGDDRMVQLLFNAGAFVNIQDVKGRTALMYAAKNGYKSTVILLKILGADLSLQDVNGKNALIHAAKHGHADIVKILKHSEVDINAAASDDMTALMYAAQYGHEKVVMALIALGADLAIVNSQLAKNAAGIADFFGYTAVAEILYEAMDTDALADVD